MNFGMKFVLTYNIECFFFFFQNNAISYPIDEHDLDYANHASYIGDDHDDDDG